MPEDARQHPRREAPGDGPPVRILRLRQFGALFRRNGHPVVRLQEQPVLGQEPGKQHPVPLLVCHLVTKPADLLRARPQVTAVSKLPPSGSQPVSELLLSGRHRLVGRAPVHGKRLQRVTGRRLGNAPGAEDHLGQLAANVGGEGRVGAGHGDRRPLVTSPGGNLPSFVPVMLVFLIRIVCLETHCRVHLFLGQAPPFSHRPIAAVFCYEQVVDVGRRNSATGQGRAAERHGRVDDYSPAVSGWVPTASILVGSVGEVDLLGELFNDRRDCPLPAAQQVQDGVALVSNSTKHIGAVSEEDVMSDMDCAENLLRLLESAPDPLKRDAVIEERLDEQQLDQLKEGKMRRGQLLGRA